jgi:hypothetical protein
VLGTDACTECVRVLGTGAQTQRAHQKLQVLRAFGIPQENICISLVLVANFLGTLLPPTPNWSRFDLFIDVYVIFLIVFLATHCILFIFCLPLFL